MTNLGKLRLAVAGLLVTAGAASAASLTALSDIEPGRWELRERGSAEGGGGGASKTICLAQPMDLFEIRHPVSTCQHQVVENTARSATLTYQCAGIGQGRTNVTVETGRLVQVDTQGVSKGMPFAVAYEGRRIGDCAASASSGRGRGRRAS